MTPRPLLTAEWRSLVMASYEIDPVVLEPRVPTGTLLDRWDGRTFVSVVAFRFLQARVRGIPIPFHRDFEEVNLRFYVRRPTGTESRRGVVFVREIVPRRAIALLARCLYHEPYVALPMRSTVTLEEADRGGEGRLRYEWFHGRRWCRLTATTAGRPSRPAPGSLPELITEHYWGYTRDPNDATREYHVEHPRWSVWSALSYQLECDVASLWGPEFASALWGPPASVFVADGSRVSVHVGGRLTW